MTKEMTTSTLLINEAFALRQRNGNPVFTDIKTIERPYTETEIDNIINNLNKQRSDKGLTLAECIDVSYKEMLKKTPKKMRVKIDYPINLSKLERIIITPNGKGYISTYFLEFCKVHNMPIYFVDCKGKIEMSFMPFRFVRPSKVMKQYEAITNGKSLEIAKYIISLKVKAEGNKHLIPRVEKARDIIEVISIEGVSSEAYFGNWKFDDEWNWKGRHGRHLKNNKFAVDEINTMLNFGYGLLGQQMSEILLKRGFELSIGFIHRNETRGYYWNILAYDFLEPYRVWIDETVKDMIAKKEIKPSDFTYTEDKSHMIFKDKALEIALERFMKTLEPLEHKALPIIRHVEGML